MRLWLKITLTVTFLSILAAGSITFFVNQKVKLNLNEAYYEWSNTLSKSITQSIVGLTIEGDVRKTQDILRRIISESHDIEYIMVVDFSNKIFASTLNSTNIPKKLVEIDHSKCSSVIISNNEFHSEFHNEDNGKSHASNNLKSLSFIMDGYEVADYTHHLINNLGAHIHLGLKNTTLTNTLSAIEHYSLLIAIIISFLGFFAALFLGRKISSPIEELSKRVSEFGKTGNYQTKFIDTSDKDILRLITNFEKMFNDRIKYEKEISNYKKHLEDLVGERTQQLQEKIVEHENTEKELIEEKEISDNANRIKSDFLSHMSHELRTPLNAVIGFSQLLEMDDDGQVKDYAKEILRAGHHLLSLINDILDLSKIEAGKLELSIEEVNWNEVVDECYALLKYDIDKKKINFNFDPGNNIYIVRVDRVRLKQAVLNLMSNAVKYNEDSGSLRISFELKNDVLRLSVKDTGLGILEEKQNKVFSPFERLDMDKSAIDGVGIGLVITKALVEDMQGAIGFKSEFGFGSIFWLEFKLERINKLTDPIPEVKSNIHVTDENVKDMMFPVDGNKKILYIEDNPSNMKVVEKIFERYSNIEFYPAYSPSEGFEILKHTLPDIILLDINLPEMDGYAVKEILDDSTELRDITVIGLSANAMKHDIEKAERHGFTDYMSKPLDVVKFMDVIKKVLTEK